MPILSRRGWELPHSLATPESLFLCRRSVLAGMGAIGGGLLAGPARADDVGQDQVQGAARNAKYVPGRDLTSERNATTYNNYYEYGTSKDVYSAAQALPQRPWTISLDGMIQNPRTIGIDDLLKQVALEERVYRHRCVERWAMTVPWTGFPLSALVKLADPLGSAKYVVFETAKDRSMPGLRSPLFSFPYVEAVTMQEAMNELSFITTGLYGKPVPPQNGGPIRLTLPWKYGFKSCKSLVRVSFTEKRPQTFWESIAPDEYGFWANVNPAVPHPRWSQANERLLGSDADVPTQIYNGYGEFVAGMYADKTTERLFM